MSPGTPPIGPGARTRVLALLGDPVAHSLSPAFQNAGIRAAGLDGMYCALRARGEELPGLIRGLARSGGGGNVTVPHKEAAARTVDRSTEAVVRTGACNTFWAEGETVIGDNTDVAGFLDALALLPGGADPAGSRVLLLGTGGAARAALVGLLQSGVDQVAIAGRSPGRVDSLIRAVAGEDPRVAAAPAGIVPGGSTPEGLRHLGSWGRGVHFVVNATSLGLRPEDPEPLDPAHLPDRPALLDMVYARGGTAWSNRARSIGFPAQDGLEMLLAQGLHAFRRWWEIEPPAAAMRRAILEAAGRSPLESPLPPEPSD